MDSDPHALSDMFAPVIQKPLQPQSYLMDTDTTVNERPLKGYFPYFPYAKLIQTHNQKPMGDYDL